MSTADYSYSIDRSEDEDFRAYGEYDRRSSPKAHRERRSHSSRPHGRSAQFNGIHRRRNKRWAW